MEDGLGFYFCSFLLYDLCVCGKKGSKFFIVHILTTNWFSALHPRLDENMIMIMIK